MEFGAMNLLLRICLVLVTIPALHSGDRDSEIIFSSKGDGDWEIYLMAADGSQQTRLTTRPTADRFPVASPDGRWIMFGSQGA